MLVNKSPAVHCLLMLVHTTDHGALTYVNKNTFFLNVNKVLVHVEI